MGRMGAGRMGFTIIELLVVIAIIGILASLLLPALGAAKDAARNTDCRNNLKALGTAVNLYLETWNEYYPPAWNICVTPSIAWCGTYSKVAGVTYMDVTQGPLWPYLEEKRTAMCRSFTPPAVKYTGSGQISGYGINSQYVAGNPVVDTGDGYVGMTSYAKPARVSEIRNPTGTILFADCARWKSGVLTEEVFVYPMYKKDGTKNYATFHFRHNGAANAVFCDGHVEEVRPTELEAASGGECGWVGNEFMDRE